MSEVDETPLAPDCQADGCENPARYQYVKRKTCSAGPYAVSKERCEEHQLETYSRGQGVGTHSLKVGKMYPEDAEMDPHYFCKKNGGEWCVDGYEDTCPVHAEGNDNEGKTQDSKRMMIDKKESSPELGQKSRKGNQILSKVLSWVSKT